jgi:predicted nucleotidyltransferase
MAVEKIKREINPVRIMLFGSRARGDAHHHADIDLAVETEGPISKIELQGPFDIVPISRADKLLQEKIKKEGVLLYERKA